jgi:DNA-binding response OmpR family regulator
MKGGPMYLIYIADDDPNICHMIQMQLQKEGFEVNIFMNGKDLLETFESEPCDLIITDIMMPEMDGYNLCKIIRSQSMVPIIMLSAKSEEVDIIQGLELGSDDYLAKPFSLKALTIKVKNMLKRIQPTNVIEHINCKDLMIHIKEREVFIDSVVLSVSAKEYDLLVLLVKNKNEAFSRSEIIKAIWGFEEKDDTRLLDHTIKRLRKKLYEQNALFEIETIWGFGYKVGD